jgi:hypothetical protein
MDSTSPRIVRSLEERPQPQPRATHDGQRVQRRLGVAAGRDVGDVANGFAATVTYVM